MSAELRPKKGGPDTSRMIDNRRTETRPEQMTPADACRQWLGVERPAPTHYELLRLPNLTADRRAIFEAGRGAKRKLRPYQIGRYRDLALKVLAEVGRAVSVLTNPEKKRAYDGELIHRWMRRIEALYDEHCVGRPHEPGLLEEWFGACRAEGIPIVHLLPWALRMMTGRIAAWPPHGEHGLNLPGCLWIYRDVAILGQCLRESDLQRRARTVKRVQKALNIPEGLARLVAEEVSRDVTAFDDLRLVRQAREGPDRTILRLARRIRRLGGSLGRRSKVLQALAALLGRSRHDLMRLLERVDEPPVEVSPARRMAIVARKARRRTRAGGARASIWVAGKPQLLLGLGILIGSIALLVALLMVLGVWRPWGATKEGPDESPARTGEPEPPEAPAEAPEPPPEPPPTEPTPGWEDLRRRFPAEQDQAAPGEAPPASELPAEGAGPQSASSAIRSRSA